QNFIKQAENACIFKPVFEILFGGYATPTKCVAFWRLALNSYLFFTPALSFFRIQSFCFRFSPVSRRHFPLFQKFLSLAPAFPVIRILSFGSVFFRTLLRFYHSPFQLASNRVKSGKNRKKIVQILVNIKQRC
ncbi:MAG: hypothetical protein U0N03_06955, partial [Lachnospiraceae bacterium]